MITIKNRFTGAVLFSGEYSTIAEALQAAITSSANLRGANLRYANLSDADLRGAYLSGADLSGSVLRGADLRDADLIGANLRGAYLSCADLSGADLSGAYLSGAYLRGAYLRGAYLRDADLRDAYLNGALNIICLPVGDPRGYRPVAVWFGDHWVIYSGCRQFTIAEAREHWGDAYKGERSTGDRYLYACDWLEKQPIPEAADRKAGNHE